jgi:hypothetical protein
MLDGLEVVGKRDGKWIRAQVIEGKLKKKKTLDDTKLGALEPDLITLREYTRKHGLTVDNEQFKKKFKMRRIYVIDQPQDSKDEEKAVENFEKWWWKEFNKVCITCTKDCKQSSQVVLVACPSYQKAA